MLKKIEKLFYDANSITEHGKTIEVSYRGFGTVIIEGKTAYSNLPGQSHIQKQLKSIGIHVTFDRSAYNNASYRLHGGSLLDEL